MMVITKKILIKSLTHFVHAQTNVPKSVLLSAIANYVGALRIIFRHFDMRNGMCFDLLVMISK